LKLLQICRAPAIERVGLEFLQPQHDHRHTYQPKLHNLTLTEMMELEEWEWEENVQAMPLLEEFLL
jgi:hypothetical protein